MNRIYRTILCLAAGAGLIFAQGYRGGANPSGRRAATGSTLAMTSLQTVSGVVSAVTIGYGIEYPSITVNQLQIKVAPVWYLLEKNFEIRAGDSLSIVAARSIVTTDPYYYAVEISNTGTKAHIVLRDSGGLPLWSQRVGGAGAGMTGTPCDVLSISTASGLVEQVVAGPGIRMPSLTLKTSAGKLLVMKIGPERLLLESDLELKAGDAISVRYALTSNDGELVALSITKGALTVTLRGDDARPIWR